MTNPHALLKRTAHAAELIAGDPARLAAAVDELRVAATHAATVADYLRSTYQAGWTGAAAEATRDRISRQASDYEELTQALHTAADALGDHRDALASAQHQTQEAINRWHAADRQTTIASHRYQQLAEQKRFEAFQARQQNQPAPRPLAPGSDPMAAEKNAAVEQWHDAERHYAESVATARAALQTARDQLPELRHTAAVQPPLAADRAAVQQQTHQQLASGATAVQMLPQVDSWDSWSADHPDRATGELTAPPGEREDSP